MAARNPTDYVAWYNETKIIPRAQIIYTVPSSVADDQAFILDQEELIVSDCFVPFRTTSAAFVTVGVYHTDSKDMCGVVGVSNNEISHAVVFLAWNSDGATTGEVRLTSTLATASTSYTYSVLVGDSAAAWRGAGAMNIKTNGNEDTLTLEARVTGGAGAIYVAGLGVFAAET